MNQDIIKRGNDFEVAPAAENLKHLSPLPNWEVRAKGSDFEIHYL